MTALLTLLALVAFAANSLLCRLALRGGAIDPAGFTVVRLAAGAAMLVALAFVMPERAGPGQPRSWYGAAMLFLYAAGFSYAYTSLSAGTGALILFGAVQVTMLVAAARQGERLNGWQGIGLACAAAGVLYLLLPGLAAPSPAGATLMTASGIAWGLYSVRGRRALDPAGQTRQNFVLTIPMAVALAAASWPRLEATTRGVTLALISGAITSGLGYVIWYRALRGLGGVKAALVQLATPILTAAGGILFLSEPLTSRLVVAALLVVGGLGLAVLTKRVALPSTTRHPEQSRGPA